MSWTTVLGVRFGLQRARTLRRWPAWLAALARVRRDLAELNHVTESDFLQVGEKLQRFLDASGRISEQCAQLVGVLSGEETERGAEDLRSSLERARAMAQQAQANRMALDQM